MSNPNQLLNVYKKSRHTIYEFSEGLEESHANWRPMEHSQNITDILFHLTDAERYWFYTLGEETPSKPDDVTLSTTMEHLKEMEHFISDLFESRSLDELNSSTETNRGNLSLSWAIKRLTHHMNYHLGTLVYLRTQLEPEWEGEAGLKHWAEAVDAFSELIPTDNS